MGRPGLTGHRKFRRLSIVLGSPIIARGALELLWESCYECGDDYVGTPRDIETLVGWTGESGQLARAMVECGQPEGAGFLEVVDGCDPESPRFRVHDLWHHAPDYVAKRRRREMDRQLSAERRRTAPTSDCPAGDGRTPSPSPKSVCPEPLTRSVPAADDQEPVVLLFPVVGSDGPEWRLRRRQVEEWAALFPGLDVLAECQHALAWIQAQLGRRKTARGMPKFLVGWLGRSVDRGRATRGDPPAERPFSAKELDEAQTWRRKLGGCGHRPHCDDRTACLGRFIRERLRGEEVVA